VLSIVHRQGPVSRSALTTATGLNRSTIGALVGELADLGLVHESDPGANNRVGRPSPVVTAESRVVALAVNPEIDAVTVGVVGLDGVVQHRMRRETDGPVGAQEAAQISAEVIGELSDRLDAEHPPVAIGVAMPGQVRASDGLVRWAPHLGWVDEPFTEMLAELTGLRVAAANDASLGANAERLFGAGRGVRDLVYLNGGASGIGSGAIVGGRPLTGFAGYAGEWGHTLVNSAGIRCHCGAIGCLETEVSQAALLRVLGLDVADPDERDRALAASSDPAVAAEVERQLGFLAVAVRNATNVFNPQLVVLGGFLGALTAAAPGRLEELVSAQVLRASGESLQIVRAELGSALLMVGAAELAFRPLLADPASYGLRSNPVSASLPT